MIRTILAYFGYVKIPKEAILLSMSIEDLIVAVAKQGKCSSPEAEAYISMRVEAAKTITNFLRSGRLISYKG